MASIRHEFYETDEKLTLSIFDKGADPAQVSLVFEPRKVTYTHGAKTLVLEPLKGQIDPAASEYTVGKVKVEVRLAKRAHGRWGALIGDSPDPLSNFASTSASASASASTSAPTASTSTSTPSASTSTSTPTPTSTAASPSSTSASALPTRKAPKKNWDALTSDILKTEKEKTSEEDPNVGGDTALNAFFQRLFGDADEDTRRAMMKSYQESGGTTLSTNWDEVRKGKVEVKPPAGAEYKKWN